MKLAPEKSIYKKGLMAGVVGVVGATATRLYKLHNQPEDKMPGDMLFMAIHQAQVKRVAAALSVTLDKWGVNLDHENINTLAFIAVKQGDPAQLELEADNGELQLAVEAEVDTVLGDDHLRQMISFTTESRPSDWDQPGTAYGTIS